MKNMKYIHTELCE